MANEIDIVIKSTDKSDGGFKSVRKNKDELAASLKSLSSGFATHDAQVKQSNNTVQRLSSGYLQASGSLKDASNAVDTLKSKTGDLGSTTTRATSAAAEGHRNLGRSAQDSSIGLDKTSSASTKLTKNLDGVKSSISNATGAFAGFAKQAAVTGTVLLGAKAFQVATTSIKDWTQQAIDARETYSKAMTVFGDGYQQVKRFAEGAAQSIGLSEKKTLDTAASFNNMFKQLKIGGAEADQMSIKMTQLAADFASFHNADITHVLEAQAAAFRGEYDSLQQFVPTIKAAAVQQKALEMTGKKSTKQLTDSELALAAYTFMLDNAGAALGDFSRTANSDANMQRRSQAAWEDSTEQIGHRFIPIMRLATEAKMKLVKVINDKIVPALDKATDWWDANKAQVMELVNEFKSNLTPVMEKIGDFIQSTLIPVWEKLATAISGLMKDKDTLKGLAVIVGTVLVAAFGLLAISVTTVMILVTGFLAVIKGIVAGVQAVAGGAVAAWQWLADKTSSTWEAIKSKVLSVIESVKTFFSEKWNSFVNIASDVGARIVAIWDRIKAPFVAVFDFLVAVAKLAFQLIILPARLFIETLIAIWNQIKGPIFDVWESVKNTVLLAVAWIKTQVDKGIQTLIGIWRTVTQPIIDIWERVKQIIYSALSFITGRVNSEVNKAKAPWESLRSKVAEIFEKIKAVVRSAMQWVYDHTIGKLNEITSRINGLTSKIKNISVSGIKSKLSGLPGFATGGIASGGYALVGERGPELRSLQPGERIKSNPTSRAELSQSRYSVGGGGGVTVNVHGSILSERDLVRIIKDTIKNGGFAGVL